MGKITTSVTLNSPRHWEASDASLARVSTKISIQSVKSSRTVVQLNQDQAWGRERERERERERDQSFHLVMYKFTTKYGGILNEQSQIIVLFERMQSNVPRIRPSLRCLQKIQSIRRCAPFSISKLIIIHPL